MSSHAKRSRSRGKRSRSQRVRKRSPRRTSAPSRGCERSRSRDGRDLDRDRRGHPEVVHKSDAVPSNLQDQHSKQQARRKKRWDKEPSPGKEEGATPQAVLNEQLAERQRQNACAKRMKAA